MTSDAALHDIVLVGGGHTHVLVMTALARRPLPGIRLTLVSDRREAPYSGMLPGHVAGFYRHDEMHIDLVRLAQATGTRLIEAQATGLDRQARRLLMHGHEPLPYDTLSLDIGITPDLSAIEGAATHAIAVKPISAFLAKFDTLLAAARHPGGPRRIAVVGGGAAGVELAFALRTRMSAEARQAGRDPHAFTITLVGDAPLLPTLNAGVRSRVAASLARRNIATVTGFRVAKIDSTDLTSRDGRTLASDAILLATAARAASWLAQAGLPVAPDGSVLTGQTLQLLDDDAVFAVGDCAVVADDPRPKAGVFAVRQAPTLAANLRARIGGAAMTPHRAQRVYLTLLATGDGRAIAGRGDWLAYESPLVWRWKDWIDRRFMQRFSRIEQP